MVGVGTGLALIFRFFNFPIEAFLRSSAVSDPFLWSGPSNAGASFVEPSPGLVDPDETQPLPE